MVKLTLILHLLYLNNKNDYIIGIFYSILARIEVLQKNLGNLG